MATIENLEVAGNDTDDADFTAEDAQAVHAALDQLAAEHREVLLLRFIEDMSYDDIAEVVDCPIGTVRSRIHNAKRALKRILQPRDTGEAP
jgi:RNA polymerase sigma-70 factor (ECF subfamily)